MPTFIPFWEHFPATFKIIFGHAAGACKCVWAQNGPRKELGDPDGCKFWKHDDAIVMMTWYAMHDTQEKTRQQQRITGGHLAHRSRGVTTLHHYERISARDLEWHRRGKEEEEVRWNYVASLTNEWNQRTLRGWKIKRKKTMKMFKVENNPLEKRNKER